VITVRLDLTPFEASKAKLRQIEAAEREKVAQDGPVSGGRGNRGGDREVARRTGLSRQEVQRTKRHVSIGEKYPVLAGPEWSYPGGWRNVSVTA